MARVGPAQKLLAGVIRRARDGDGSPALRGRKRARPRRQLARIGPRRAYVATIVAEAAALVLLALVPSSLTAAIASALLFGSAYNATLAIEAIWSAHIFADRPSLGISAVMASNGVGMLLGPLGAGLLAGRFGLAPVLVAGAAVVAAAGMLAPRGPILPQPEPGSQQRAERTRCALAPTC